MLLGFVALKLGADIGSDVQEITPRAHQQDPSLRSKYFVDLLCMEGRLDGKLRIPNAAGDLEIDVDLKARQISAAVEVDAPADKRLRGQVSWLVRQLPDAAQSRTGRRSRSFCHESNVNLVNRKVVKGSESTVIETCKAYWSVKMGESG